MAIKKPVAKKKAAPKIEYIFTIGNDGYHGDTYTNYNKMMKDIRSSMEEHGAYDYPEELRVEIYQKVKDLQFVVKLEEVVKQVHKVVQI